MKRRRTHPIKQASVALGSMGYDRPWTMDMAMKRWEQGEDVFRPAPPSPAPPDIIAIRTRILDAVMRAEQYEPAAPASNEKKPWWKRIFE